MASGILSQIESWKPLHLQQQQDDLDEELLQLQVDAGGQFVACVNQLPVTKTLICYCEHLTPSVQSRHGLLLNYIGRNA